MQRIFKCLATAGLMFTLVSPGGTGSAQAPGDVAAALAQRLQALHDSGEPAIRGVRLLAAPLIFELYARRERTSPEPGPGRRVDPLWRTPERVDELLNMVQAAGNDGLDPDDYLVTELQALHDEFRATGGAVVGADLDILLTESLIRYGYHQRFGKVNNRTFDPNINFSRELEAGKQPIETLRAAIEAPSLQQFLNREIPRGPLYRQLRQALVEYHGILDAGGWSELDAGPTLRPGEQGPRIEALRRRLALTGDLPDGAPPGRDVYGDVYDASIEQGVRNFQARHSLEPDGVLGPATLAALNVPVHIRIDQLRLSLERLRWVAKEIVDDEFVVVNIAGFRVFFVRGREIEWVSRAMVGRNYRQTPVFRGDIQYVVLNPTWTIPPGILRNDVLPAIKADPGYLAARNISVIDRDGQLVDPATVDWQSYTTGMPYTLRQEPGPNNAMGVVKLIFPNEHFVFLHDTPSRSLFDRAERAFSSGCIRVEDPLRLTELVLDDPTRWDRAALEAKIEGGVQERVNLGEPMPVLIVYLTASLEPDGRLRFLKDIYARDERLLEALDGDIDISFPGTH